MKTEFTKGEWFAKEGNVYQIETGKTLAILPYYDKKSKEQKANANIMAAAPEMLEALRLASSALELCYQYMRDKNDLNLWNKLAAPKTASK